MSSHQTAPPPGDGIGRPGHVLAWRLLRLLLEQHLKAVWWLDFDDSICPVVPRRLCDRLEVESDFVAQRDDGIDVCDAKLPCDPCCARVYIDPPRECELNMLVAHGKKVGILGALVGRSKAQRLAERSFSTGITYVQNRNEFCDRL